MAVRIWSTEKPAAWRRIAARISAGVGVPAKSVSANRTCTAAPPSTVTSIPAGNAGGAPIAFGAATCPRVWTRAAALGSKPAGLWTAAIVEFATVIPWSLFAFAPVRPRAALASVTPPPGAAIATCDAVPAVALAISTW